MKHSTVKFCRGQVWFLPTVGYESNNKKMNMYLVISDESSNTRNRLANVIHILPKTKNQIFPMQIPVNYYNSEYVIDCDKIDTVNASNFEYGSYEFSLSEDTMNQVVEKVSIQLGLTNYIPGFDSMLRIVELLGKQYKQTIENKTAITNEQVDKICQAAISSIEKSYAEPEVKPEIKTTKISAKHKTTRLQWTDDRKLEFLVDGETLNKQDLAAKYSISPSSVYGYKCKFSKDLKLK